MTLQTESLALLDGRDGMLAAFETVPLVALGEMHGWQEEADFITALVHHPAFPSRVNDIVWEIGNAQYQELVDRFVVAGEPVANADLRPVWRNMIGNPYGFGDTPIYEQFFRTVRAVNRMLPYDQRIRVLLGDPPVDWSVVQTRADIEPFPNRDLHFARVVEREVLKKGRHALLIAGNFHTVRIGPEQPNVIGLIEQWYPRTTQVVVPHVGFSHRNTELEPLLASWSIPTLAYIQGTWLGTLDPRLLFAAELDWASDIYEGVTLADVADAYLYLGPRATLTASHPNPAIYRGDPDYLAEIQRRHQLLHGQPLDTAWLFAEHEPYYHRDG